MTAVTLCHWCGVPAADNNTRPPWVCKPCLGPVAPVAKRLRAHHVHPDMYRRLLTDPTCELCGEDILTPRHDPYTKRSWVDLVVDHDHRCCPAGRHSCGSCVRGFICGRCNKMLGDSGDQALPILDAIDVLVTRAEEIEVRIALLCRAAVYADRLVT